MTVTDYAVQMTTSTLDATGAHTANILENHILQQIRAIAGLCNAGEFDDHDSAQIPLSERKIFGDATDQAMLRFSEGLGSVAELRSFWKTLYTLSFDSKNKFMIKVMKPTGKVPRLFLSQKESKEIESGNL